MREEGQREKDRPSGPKNRPPSARKKKSTSLCRVSVVTGVMQWRVPLGGGGGRNERSGVRVIEENGMGERWGGGNYGEQGTIVGIS